MLIGGAHGDIDGVAGLLWDDAAPYDAATNVFLGFLPAKPNRCVAVFPTGGFESDSKLPYDSPTIQIMVRGDEDPAWALDMAQAVYDYLQAKRYVDLPDDTHLMWLIAVQSGPIHIGKDANGRFQYSLNFRSETRNPTVERDENA